jgi:hypothetical protein
MYNYYHQPLSQRQTFPTTASSATLVEPPTPHPYYFPQHQHPSNHYAAYNEPSTTTYFQPQNYQTDYVNTYLTNNTHQRQEKYYDETPSRSSSLVSYRDSGTTTCSSSGIERNTSMKSVINTHQLQPIETVPTTPISLNEVITPMTTGTPEYAYLSVLSKTFLRRVRGLENVRELFCANEYPESFTGSHCKFFFFLCNM